MRVAVLHGGRSSEHDVSLASAEAAMSGGYVETVSVYEDPAAELEEEDRANWARLAVIALVLLALAALAFGAYSVFTPEKKSVPDVVGKRSGNAAQQLQAAGFEVDIVPIQSDTVPDDRVAGQRPEAGEEADEGSTVTITVSSGPGEAPIPLVQGLPADEAEERLRDAGFRTERRSELSDTVRSGRVIETAPSEGTSVRKGTTVTLIVSRGKERIAVPDVVGSSREDAERTIQDAGLQVATSEEESEDEAPGTVLRQDPAAGTEIAKGKTVSIVVAEAPADVPVPGVIDATEEDAVQALEEAGFEVEVERTPVETPDEDGLVTEQDPAPDTPRPQGSTVTITVGRFEPADPEPTATETPAPTVEP